MFSKRLATAQLQMLSEASAQSETGLWIPEYHSLSQIESFNSHFNAIRRRLRNRTGQTTICPPPLVQIELAWINNEYQICWCDDRYWMESYAFINADGTFQRFKPTSFPIDASGHMG